MFGPTTRTVWIKRPDGRPVRMWTIWGPDTSGLQWNNGRWREFADGDYRMIIGEWQPISFRIVDGRAYLENGLPLQLR